MTKISKDWEHKLRESNARYVVDTQGEPIGVLLTMEEYETYLDLLDDERDRQDDDLATRLAQAATRLANGERQIICDYMARRIACTASVP